MSSDQRGRGRGRGGQSGGYSQSGGQRRDDRGGYRSGRGGGGGGGRTVTCHKCGEEGHYANECPQSGGRGGASGSRDSSRSRGGGGGGGRTVTCFKCGEEGHFANDCPKSGGSRGGASGSRDSRGGGGYRGRGGGGSRGGYGSGPSRADSPIRTDVREIAQSVEIEPQFKTQNKGTKGKEVELITNHFPIEETKDLVVCHYDIDINLRKRDGQGLVAKRETKSVRNEKQTENRQIIERMINEWPHVKTVLIPNTYAYDGNKILFTVEELGIGSEGVTREVTITLDGFPEQTYEVRVQFARNVPMNEYNTSDEFADVRHVMDIVLRDRMQRSLVGVGRNLFKRDDKNTIPLHNQNCEIVFGHHQSIQNTESGLTVNVDRVTTTFRTRNVEEPLIDFLKRELQVNDLKVVNFDRSTTRTLSKKLRDLKIYTNHIGANIGCPQKRKSGIESMSDVKPREHTFKDDEGNRQNIEQYFKNKYGVTLLYKDIPLLMMKGSTKEKPKYLPPELCYVYPNQPMPKTLINTDIQRQIVEATNTQTPLKRFEKIQDSVEKISDESQALMETFGLQIKAHPIKLKGRELPEPKVMGNNRRLNQTVNLTNSLFINLSPNVKRNLQEYFNNFFNGQQFGLIATARGMGFNVQMPRLIGENADIFNIHKQMETFDRGVKKGSVQMVFVCIPDDPPLYEFVKHLSENVCGIVTQCIKDSLFMRTKPGYFNNFLLKTNAKLNGQNQALEKNQTEFRPRELSDPNNKTMVIGADVTHPGIHNPLAKERVISSIAAVVGSYDQDFTKFMATVSAQGANTEFIEDFGVMFENLLRGFNKINKKYPQNIVLFRDGVSDSQLDAVLTGEIPQMERVYEKLKLPKPKITAYVVQKRHHTRIFLSKPNVDRSGKPLFNMKSGTVVDHTITNPDLDEFHLCSHSGRLGTSRHAKYVELRNDHNLNKNQLQMLAYSMCFTYCRCLTPISIPIPVKYADLAAYRAKQHTAAQNTIFEQANRNETEDQRKDRERKNIRKLNETMIVDENIKVIPYYC